MRGLDRTLCRRQRSAGGLDGSVLRTSSAVTGTELRAARERLGMTQRALAEALGISLSQLGNFEREIHRQTGRPCPIPPAIELAVRYLLSQANNESREGRWKAL
jgi:DNA-binding XRE family transcriptional regulator